ncbi:MAG: penicillin-binding transpeptidase domain-containing protein [Candidatus Paceibacterota bacterium]
MNRKFWRKNYKRLDPDEVFMDSRNLPSFNDQQFEGQIEKPISKKSAYILAGCIVISALILGGRVGFLQVLAGQDLAHRSEQNKLRHSVIFADRGIVYDRHNQELAWNNPDRVYIDRPGFAHILGYVGYPNAEDIARESFHPKSLIGKSGVERTYHQLLAGQAGLRIEEVNSLGEVSSNHVLRYPESGDSLVLAIDAEVQAAFHRIIAEVADSAGYRGGAAVLMEAETGEIVSLVSYPEFDPTVMSKASDRQQIASYILDEDNPFLNRPVAGLYSPGSIIKPFIALAALAENIISPEKQIESTGRLIVPNPYNPDRPTIFRDWRAHGYTDMRRALAVSSDVYFYQIGGGFESQPGLGIARIEDYVRKFGFGRPTGIDLSGEATGTIPNPEWKEANFDGDPWRLGNTYHTAIGQYGFLVSPIQAARATAALATAGRLPTPTLIKRDKQLSPVVLDFASTDWQVVQEGMRQAVTAGTAASLNVPYVQVAAKTGTAEVGSQNQFINAWIIGYFPYENPKYVFAVVLEQGRSGTLIGGGMVMRRLLDWLKQNAPEYFTVD